MAQCFVQLNAESEAEGKANGRAPFLFLYSFIICALILRNNASSSYIYKSDRNQAGKTAHYHQHVYVDMFK